jgi:ferredoxin
MVNPAFTSEAIEAELTGLLGDDDLVAGVMLHCSRMAPPPDQPGWFRVAVPCVGMLPPHWILAPLRHGAAAVAVVPCDCGKETDAAARVAESVASARSWLGAAGWDDAVVRVLDAPDALPLNRSLMDVDGSVLGPRGAVAMAVGLGVMWRDDLAPLGRVLIDDETCTGCEMCATVCPSDALRSRVSDNGLAIDFDAALCTACHQCLDRCPEDGAIRLEYIIDPDAVVAGATPLVAHTLVACVKCGGSIATEAALTRIASSLGSDPTILKQVTSVCLDCRGSTMVF